MSCGCSGKRVAVSVEGRVPSVPQGRGHPIDIVRRTLRARAAACHLCPRAIRHGAKPWTHGAIACIEDGKTAVEHIAKGVDCPLGRFPDEHGIVRRYGVQWYGVPFPDRLILWFHKRKPAICTAYAGCGCVIRLKDLFSRIPGLRRLTICKARA